MSDPVTAAYVIGGTSLAVGKNQQDKARKQAREDQKKMEAEAKRLEEERQAAELKAQQEEQGRTDDARAAMLRDRYMQTQALIRPQVQRGRESTNLRRRSAPTYGL